MLDLANHIINTKKGTFDPKAFDDRYEAALAELVKAKAEGREIAKPTEPLPAKVANLMDAFRQSAKMASAPKPARRKPPPSPRVRKAS